MHFSSGVELLVSYELSHVRKITILIKFLSESKLWGTATKGKSFGKYLVPLKYHALCPKLGSKVDSQET